MKMTVHFRYPALVQMVRQFDFHLGTRMYQITPLEDDERGFNGPDGAMIVLNRRYATWEYSDVDGKFVRRGNDLRKLVKLLNKRHKVVEKKLKLKSVKEIFNCL